MGNIVLQSALFLNIWDLLHRNNSGLIWHLQLHVLIWASVENAPRIRHVIFTTELRLCTVFEHLSVKYFWVMTVAVCEFAYVTVHDAFSALVMLLWQLQYVPPFASDLLPLLCLSDSDLCSGSLSWWYQAIFSLVVLCSSGHGHDHTRQRMGDGVGLFWTHDQKPQSSCI